MKKSNVRGSSKQRRMTDKGRATVKLEKPLRVEIESLFVPYGEKDVEKQEIVVEHDTGKIYMPEELAYRAAELMRDCAASGVNLTIENRPMWPLSMGNYCSKIVIRQTRAIVTKILNEYYEKFAHLKK